LHHQEDVATVLAVPGIDLFVVIAGTFSIVTTVPLAWLTYRGYCDARQLRVIQQELAELLGEIRELQVELGHEQRVATSGIEETKRTVERVAEQTERRRRIPRLSVSFER
jgi:hypothetical protein